MDATSTVTLRDVECLPIGMWVDKSTVCIVERTLVDDFVFVTVIRDGIAEGPKRGIAKQFARHVAELCGFNFTSAVFVTTDETPIATNPWLSEHPARSRCTFSGWVYFMQADCGGPIKIGKSTFPKYRRDMLQVGCPFPLVILAAVPNDGLNKESALHHRFAAERLHGEWFRASKRLLHFIRSLDCEESAS